MSSANKDNFTFFLSNLDGFYSFSYLIALAISTILKDMVRADNLVLLLILGNEAFNPSTLSIMLALRSS